MINQQRPTVLIYRRTHTGDPDENGVFGCHGCMKSVRSWPYDAVIGVGGKKPDKGSEGIAYKVNWIGIGPIKHRDVREPLVTFSKFVRWDENGPWLYECAPKLYQYMFDQGHIPRTGKSFPDHVYSEILQILELAKNVPPSKGISDDVKLNLNNKCCPLPDEFAERSCS